MNKKYINHRITFVLKILKFWNVSSLSIPPWVLSYESDEDGEEDIEYINNMGKYRLIFKNGEEHILNYKCNSFEEIIYRWIKNNHKLKTIFYGIVIPIIGWLGYEGVKNIFK